jgi:membrane protease subunit HflC
MKLNLIGGILATILILALIVAYSTLYTVHQTQQALIVRLGDPVDVVTAPGLHFKIPLVDSVIYVDKRILDLDNPQQEVIAADQKRIVVDAFARYRIDNVLRFYQSVANIEGANSRLATLLNSALRRVLGEASLEALVRDERAQLMTRIRQQMGKEARNFGITVVDVRIRRADLPEANSQAVFQRMQTERQREAAEFRAQGSERAQQIRARADRDVTVLIAEATAKAEQIRGEGDAERNRIFADAYGRDIDFFSFYRSMQAYEVGLRPGETRMVLKPDSDFFRFFGDQSGRARATATTPTKPPPTGAPTPPPQKPSAAAPPGTTPAAPLAVAPEAGPPASPQN